MIDPTAIIHSSAELASDVTIGAYSIISADVRIDSGTAIGPHVVIRGPTKIGRDNKVYQFSSIGEDPQDKKYHGEITRLDIGDRNVIREYCTIHRGTVQDQGLTRVGNDNLLMAYSHIAHDCVIGQHVIMANGASLAGHVYVEDYAVLGGFSLVHQFCRIGRHSFSAMGSAIVRDIPPYVMVGGRPTKPHGINAVGLERQGFSPDVLRQLKKAYKVLYKSGLKLEDAISELEEMTKETAELACFVDFLLHTGRSIIR